MVRPIDISTDCAIAAAYENLPMIDTTQACRYLMVMIESPPDVEVHDINVSHRFDLLNKL